MYRASEQFQDYIGLVRSMVRHRSSEHSY